MDENELEERANKMIDDKDVQTTVNSDGLEGLLEERGKVENVIYT